MDPVTSSQIWKILRGKPMLYFTLTNFHLIKSTESYHPYGTLMLSQTSEATEGKMGGGGGRVEKNYRRKINK
jgi:hypothetical protein